MLPDKSCGTADYSHIPSPGRLRSHNIPEAFGDGAGVADKRDYFLSLLSQGVLLHYSDPADSVCVYVDFLFDFGGYSEQCIERSVYGYWVYDLCLCDTVVAERFGAFDLGGVEDTAAVLLVARGELPFD